MAKLVFWHKVQRFLAIAMGAFFGVFLGYCLWTAWDHMARPELYAMNSAPWASMTWVYMPDSRYWAASSGQAMAIRSPSFVRRNSTSFWVLVLNSSSRAVSFFSRV